jgi:hypothetical protein
MRKVWRWLVPVVLAAVGLLQVATPVLADGIPPFP